MIRSLLMPHRLISLDLAAGSRRDYQHIAQFGNASSSSSYADVPFSRTPGSAVPAESIIALNVQGNVLWFDFAGGFGRIARKDGKEDVFVHATEIVPTNKDHRQLTELGEGEPVEFDIVEDRSNGTRRAIRVTGPAGAPVQGRWTLFRHFAFGQKLKRSEVMPYKADGRIIARNVRGTVAYFSVPYGYGFITRSDTGNDVFAHFRDIVVANPKHAVKSLGTGETVRFHILLESHGRVKAVGITGPNGEAVMGDVNAEGPATRDILRRAGTTLLGGRSPLLARRSLVHGSAVTGLRFVGTGTSADNSSPVNVDTNGPLNEMISKLLEPFKCVLKKQDNLRRLISEMEVPTSTPTSTPIGVLPLFTYSSDWRWIVDKNLIMVVASLTIAFSIIAVIMVAASWYINGTVNELKVEGKQQRDEMRMEGKQQRDEMRMEGKQQREELKQQVDRIENLMKKLIAGL